MQNNLNSKAVYKDLLLRALIPLAAGIALIVWKDITVRSIVMLFGAIFFVNGLTSLMRLYRVKRANPAITMNAVGSLGNIILGLFLLLAPVFFVNMLMYVVGAAFMLLALAQITSLVTSHRPWQDLPWFFFLSPVLILILGVLVFVNPWGGATVVVILLGIIMILYGTINLLFHYHRIRYIRRTGKDIKLFYDEPGTEDPTP